MKTLGAIFPWIVVTTVLGAVVWWLLSNENALGRWLLAGLLVVHGAVHLLFAIDPSTSDGTPWPFEMGDSWLIQRVGLDGGLVRAGGWAIVTVAVLGFAVVGLAVMGVAVPAGWWPTVVIVPSVASAAVLLMFFNPQLVLGLGIDALLVWMTVASTWQL